MNTQPAPRVTDLAQQLDDTYHAIEAFNYLLGVMFEYSAAAVEPRIGYGINELLRRQLDDLKDIRSAVFDLSDQSRSQDRQTTERPPVYPVTQDQFDLGQIARDTNLAEATVRRVVERLLADPQAAAPATQAG